MLSLGEDGYIGLLYLKVCNNIGGDIPIDAPQPKYWVGCVPGIPGGVDDSGAGGQSSLPEKYFDSARQSCSSNPTKHHAVNALKPNK